MIFKNFIWIMQKINWLGSVKDEHGNYLSMKNATTNDTIVQHGSEETNALLRGREDNLNSETNEGPTSEECNSKPETSADSSAMEGNSNSAKPASHLTPVTNNSNSLTSAENDPKPEVTASQTQMAASSNFETFGENGSKPEAISSEAAASVLPISNATSNSNEKSVTGMVFVCIDLLDLSILHVVIIFQIKICCLIGA